MFSNLNGLAIAAMVALVVSVPVVIGIGIGLIISWVFL